MPDFKVRAIERRDRAQWEPLWRAYLVFYRAQWSDEVANATFARIFDPLEPMHALVAERGEELVGFTHYLFQRSTWLINSAMLSPGPLRQRGGAAGRRRPDAYRRIADAAKQAGAARVYWHTHETNTVARRLYDAVAERPGFIQYRIELMR